MVSGAKKSNVLKLISQTLHPFLLCPGMKIFVCQRQTHSELLRLRGVLGSRPNLLQDITLCLFCQHGLIFHCKMYVLASLHACIYVYTGRKFPIIHTDIYIYVCIAYYICILYMHVSTMQLSSSYFVNSSSRQDPHDHKAIPRLMVWSVHHRRMLW